MEPSTGVNGADIVITATTVQQINDSLYHTNTTKDKKGSLAEKFEKILADEDVDQITVTIESATIEMENGGTINLPTSKLDDRTFNLKFTSTFKKSVGILRISDQDNLDKLNITLPNGNFGELHLDVQYSTVKISGSGNSEVWFSANTNENYKMPPGSGLKVSAKYKDILPADKKNVVADGASVVAVVAENDNVEANKNGVASGIYGTDNKVINVKSVIARNNETITYAWSDEKTPTLLSVTAKDGAYVSLKAYASEIIGELDQNGKASAELYINGDEREDIFNAIEKAKNVKLSGGFYPTVAAADLSNSTLEFYGYYFDDAISSIKDVEFKTKQSTSNNTYFYVNVPAHEGASSYTFTFKNAKFPDGAKFSAIEFDNELPELDADGNPVKVTWYFWTTGEFSTNIYSWTLIGGYYETEEEAAEYMKTLSIGQILTYSKGDIRKIYDLRVARNATYGYYVQYRYQPMIIKSSKDFNDIPADLRKKYPKEDTTGYTMWWTVKDAPVMERSLTTSLCLSYHSLNAPAQVPASRQ